MTRTSRRKEPLPKAIIFDLDGTLVISTIRFMKFRTRLLSYIREKGANMSTYNIKDTTVAMISRFEQEMRAKGRDERSIDSFLSGIESFLDEIELENIEKTRPVAGAIDLLSDLRGMDVKIGVLTRGSPEYARRALEIAGLDRFVDATVARDRKSGIRPKPHPESVYALAEKLGVSVEDAVMVGDYSIDFDCAREGNIRFYGIASEKESRRSLSEAGCTDILSGLRELRERIGL
jgi:phosphoglycolate phosphatase